MTTEPEQAQRRLCPRPSQRRARGDRERRQPAVGPARLRRAIRITLGAGLDFDLTLLTGCQPPDLLDPDLYRRLVSDLRTNGKLVIADLTGAPLRAALAGGIEMLRLSDEQLVSERYAASDSETDIAAGARRLPDAGARYVLVSRRSAPVILIGGDSGFAQIDLAGPRFEALDRHGTGYSMFAATGVGLARGMRMIDALRLGMAAGALNATRRGLGTGTREEIERLATHVRISPALAAVERRIWLTVCTRSTTDRSFAQPVMSAACERFAVPGQGIGSGRVRSGDQRPRERE